MWLIQPECYRRFRCVAVYDDVGAVKQLVEPRFDRVAVKCQSKASFVAVVYGKPGAAARFCRPARLDFKNLSPGFRQQQRGDFYAEICAGLHHPHALQQFHPGWTVQIPACSDIQELLQMRGIQIFLHFDDLSIADDE